MIANIIGVRRGIDFKADGGEHIQGTKVFWSFVEDGVDGEMCEGKFFRTSHPLYRIVFGLEPGQKVQVTFGRKNAIDGIQIVSD